MVRDRLDELMYFIESRSERLDHYGDYCKEIVDLIKKSKLDPKIKEGLLVELYRFTYYSEAWVAIDPRVDFMMKDEILNRMENEVRSKSANEQYLKELKESIDELRKHVDNPLITIDENNRFFTEHPGAIF